MKRARRVDVAVDDGGAALLSLGFGVCAAMLLAGGVSVTSAQLARSDVMDVAAHASAAAADRISEDAVYRNGVQQVTLNPATARSEAQRVLASTVRPSRVTSWSVNSVTVAGNTVRVSVSATIKPAVVGTALAAIGTPMRVSINSTADAHLAQP